MSGSELEVTRMKFDILDEAANILIYSCTCAQHDFGCYFFPKRLCLENEYAKRDAV